jgi:hypothetical protein
MRDRRAERWRACTPSHRRTRISPSSRRRRSASPRRHPFRRRPRPHPRRHQRQHPHPHPHLHLHRHHHRHPHQRLHLHPRRLHRWWSLRLPYRWDPSRRHRKRRTQPNQEGQTRAAASTIVSSYNSPWVGTPTIPRERERVTTWSLHLRRPCRQRLPRIRVRRPELPRSAASAPGISLRWRRRCR